MPIRPENRNRYPKDWPEISRRIRFERAQGRCECAGECLRGTHLDRCPNVNGQPTYGTGSRVVLTPSRTSTTLPRTAATRTSKRCARGATCITTWSTTRRHASGPTQRLLRRRWIRCSRRRRWRDDAGAVG